MPIATLPDVLQWIASWNPVSVLVAAVRTLFGNPLSPIAKDIWPMRHPVAAAWIYCIVLLCVRGATSAAPLPGARPGLTVGPPQAPSSSRRQ